MKYKAIKMSGIITRIARITDVSEYTHGILEVFLPETDDMTDKEVDEWIEHNNRMMNAICDLMNEKY
jgi:hypothetical protein